MPWTAPVFDERHVTADPALYCMSSRPGLDAQGQHSDFSCTCITEQSTIYAISDGECRRIARMGPVYNPYRQQQRQQDQPQQQSQAAATMPMTRGGVIERKARGQGTFPESPGYKADTATPPTTLDM